MTEKGKLTVSLPRFDYMCQDNTYSGSCGRFRYKFFPLKKDDINTVLVAAVYFDRCYELEKAADRVTEREFPYSDEGIDQAEAFIASLYTEEEDA